MPCVNAACAPKSYRSIMASIRMLAEWADTEDIARLDHGTVQAFLYWGKEERAWEARTFRNHRQYLRSYFGWCFKQQIIKTNPIDGMRSPSCHSGYCAASTVMKLRPF